MPTRLCGVGVPRPRRYTRALLANASASPLVPQACAFDEHRASRAVLARRLLRHDQAGAGPRGARASIFCKLSLAVSEIVVLVDRRQLSAARMGGEPMTYRRYPMLPGGAAHPRRFQPSTLGVRPEIRGCSTRPIHQLLRRSAA
jgi:hypothetical protein